jgi:beta-glucosidase
MDYAQAVSGYRNEPTKANLSRLTTALCDGMTFREKTRLLHGDFFHFATRLLYGLLFHGTMFYLPFLGGGCRRLGVPRIVFSDGPKGAVTGRGTCFPSPTMRGASFDVDLESRIGKAMAREVAVSGANYFAGICINLIRNPRGGRSQESYSEDPLLLGRMGAAVVKAVQAEGVVACPKHFALNSIENLRFLESSNADERTLREIWLPHFRKCVEAGALSLMPAYNKVNGIYCAENRHLLQDILRDEWGFDGFTLSDFVWGVHDTAGALKAGLDCEMPFPRHYDAGSIRRRIRRGELAVSDVDRAVQRILGVLVRLAPEWKPQPWTVLKSQAHRALAEEAAVKGMVLLKNEGTLLPLPRTARIAVVGPFADTVNVGDKGSNLVLCDDGTTPYAGLGRKFPDTVVHGGLDPRKALDVAAGSDAVVVCIGCDAKDEGEFLINVGAGMTRKPRNAPGGDRDRLDLDPAHLELLKVLKAAGKKVIAVLYSGAVVLTENLETHTDAIIYGYYGGIGFGDALASLVCGESNFSGKLPVSIAKEEGDYPTFKGIGQKPYEIDHGYYNGYWLLEKEGKRPSYPFGFGMSYTGFRIGGVEVGKNARGGITVRATVENVGPVHGTEVVQVYVGSAGAEDHRPKKMLRGFERVGLAVGESRTVSIEVAADDLMYYDAAKKAWGLDPRYLVYVGDSSAGAVDGHVVDLSTETSPPPLHYGTIQGKMTP